ncbi:hypothetical protein DXT94_13900 [Rhizobium sp. ICMP 5592]|nr:hypothetical protein [Rhizobium sp. ICMP 5592]
MASVGSMLSRVRRLETARATPVSPFAKAYGSFEAFESEVQADIDTGNLDRMDMPIILTCLRRWEGDGTWGAWHRDRVWELGR